MTRAQEQRWELRISAWCRNAPWLQLYPDHSPGLDHHYRHVKDWFWGTIPAEVMACLFDSVRLHFGSKT